MIIRNHNKTDINKISSLGSLLHDNYKFILDGFSKCLVIEEDDNLENYVHFIATDVKTEGLPFNSINDKYSFLENSEFLIPDFFEIEKTGNL